MSDFHAEGYFVITPEWVLDADISDKAVRLYGVLRSYADHRTGVAFPSRPTLAARLHVADPKAVDRAMAELERIGAVEVRRASNAPGEARISNRYLLRHTPGGGYATTPETPQQETGSSDPGGVNATGGKKATPPGAPGPLPPVALAPLPQGRQDPYPRGASAPLTRSRELDPKNQTPPTPRERGAEELFAAFWKLYPKKVKRQDAQRAWVKAVRRTDAHKILDVLARYPFDLSRPKYVPYPASWLNAGCWEDDLDAVAAAHQEPRRGRWGGDLGGRDGYDAGDGTF